MVETAIVCFWSLVVIETCFKECGSGGDCAVINGSDQCICHRGYIRDTAGACVGK